MNSSNSAASQNTKNESTSGAGSHASKMKVLDVKIVQQRFKRIDGAEIEQSRKVYDGTGKKQLDEDNEEVAALLYTEQ